MAGAEAASTAVEAAVASMGAVAAVASTVAAVFPEAAFEVAAGSEEAASKAEAVLAEPIEAQLPLRAPVRMPVRRPVRWEARAGMALSPVVPHTAARVRMARLAAGARPTARGRELTLPERVPALLMRTLTVNGIPLGGTPLGGTPLADAPLAALVPARAAMLRPQRLAALAIRRRAPGATAIPTNLRGAVSEVPERRGQASPRIAPAPHSPGLLPLVCPPACLPPGQARWASRAPLAELPDLALTGAAWALATSASTAIASDSAESASIISAGAVSASEDSASTISALALIASVSDAAGSASVLDSAAHGAGADGDSAGAGALGPPGSALISGDGRHIGPHMVMGLHMDTTRGGIGTVSTLLQP